MGPPHCDVAQQQVVAVIVRAVVVGVGGALGKHVGGVNAVSWSFNVNDWTSFLSSSLGLTVRSSRSQRAAGVDHKSRVEDAEEMRRFGPVPVQLPVEVMRIPRGEDVLAEVDVLNRTSHLIDGLDPVLG